MELWNQPADRIRRHYEREPFLVDFDHEKVVAQRQTLAYLKDVLGDEPASVVIINAPRNCGSTHIALSLAAGWDRRSDVELVFGCRRQLLLASMHYSRLHFDGRDISLSLPSSVAPRVTVRNNFFGRRVTFSTKNFGADDVEQAPVAESATSEMLDEPLVIYDNAVPLTGSAVWSDHRSLVITNSGLWLRDFMLTHGLTQEHEIASRWCSSSWVSGYVSGSREITIKSRFSVEVFRKRFGTSESPSTLSELMNQEFVEFQRRFHEK